jgi:Protein of unknown function (DUF2510)
MTQQGPGWYPDPSGLPATFRWWDGRRWTEDITADPGSALTGGPTAGPSPETPAGAPAFHDPVPPPPGAPGPGYIPPTQRRDGTSEHPLEVLSNGDEAAEDGRRRRLTGLLVLIGIVAVLVGGGTYLALVRDGDPSASPTPSAGADERPGQEDPPSGAPSDPGDDPEATPPVEGGGEAEITPTPEEPYEGPRLRFEPRPRPWALDGQSATMFTAGRAQTQVTEARYNGTDSWVALLSTGIVDPEFFERSDLPGSAEQIADWFADTGFTGAEVDQTPRVGKRVTVDGRPGYRLEQHLTYQIDGLKSTGESIWVIVVDLGSGSGNAGGVFLASIPDTDAKLSADVEKAISSLEIVD